MRELANKPLCGRRPPNVVVVGYGYAGRAFHTYLVGLAPGLRLHGVAVGDPEKQARARQERGCAIYGTFDEAIRDAEVDLVVLATPNSTHCDLAVRALDAGKHVVTDKIMCLSLAECDRMIEAAHRNRKLLSVFQNRRWDGDFLTVRKLMADGALGELRWLELAWQGARPMGRWRGQAAMGGGRFYDLGAHLIDQALLLMPRAVESVWCRMQHDHRESDTESHAMAVIGFADGATAVIDTGSMHFLSKPHWYVAGSKGTFVKHGFDPQEGAMNKGNIDAAAEAAADFGTMRDEQGERRVPTLPGRWRNYYETIAAVLAGETPAVAPVRLAETRRVMAVVDAALRSAKSGQVVKTEIGEVEAA